MIITANSPLVSIIIPSWNGVELLKTSLPSLTRTDYPSFEIIIVDNGSLDETVSYVSKNYPAIKLIQLNVNAGFAAACNAGMGVASGKYVSFLNNDMEFEPSWLKYLVGVLESNESLAGCDSKYLNYFNRGIIDRSGGAGRFIDRYGNAFVRGGGRKDSPIFDLPIEVSYGMALLRRNIVLKVGGLDEPFFAYYEDADLCWRIRKLGGSIAFVPQSRIYHMAGATTSRTEQGQKRLGGVFVFHFCKNRLRMLLKNQDAVALIPALFVYSIDLLGASVGWVFTRQPECLHSAIRAIWWNIIHVGDSIRLRYPSNQFGTVGVGFFCSYNGQWQYYVERLQKLAQFSRFPFRQPR